MTEKETKQLAGGQFWLRDADAVPVAATCDAVTEFRRTRSCRARQRQQMARADNDTQTNPTQ